MLHSARTGWLIVAIDSAEGRSYDRKAGSIPIEAQVGTCCRRFIHGHRSLLMFASIVTTFSAFNPLLFSLCLTAGVLVFFRRAAPPLAQRQPAHTEHRESIRRRR